MGYVFMKNDNTKLNLNSMTFIYKLVIIENIIIIVIIHWYNFWLQIMYYMTNKNYTQKQFIFIIITISSKTYYYHILS